MKSVKELFQSTAKPVAVLGGGPSCPDDIKELPECIIVAVNHHAFFLPDPIKIDYVCHLDSPRVNVPIKAMYENQDFTNIKKITKFPEFSDYNLDGVHFINEGDSGMFAAWFACYLTRGPVYMCGFGLRQPGKMHFHGDEIQASCLPRSESRKTKAFKQRVGKWELVWPRLYHPERIVVISGPLKDYEPEYKNRQIIDHPKIDANIMVCGGGPSLPDDIKKIRGRVKYMAVNYHAFKLVNPDWMIFMDEYERTRGEQRRMLEEEGDFIKVSYVNNPYTNYFTQYQSPQFNLSGHLAVWVANYITRGRIFMAGFDLYQGVNEHFHNDEDDEVSSWGGPPIDKKVENWHKALDTVDRDRITFLSGPLK